MIKIIRKLLSVFNIQLSRIPSDSDSRHHAEKQLIDVALKKYGWLTKFNINKVVDIGSNDGHFASESSIAFAEVPYFCFEPIPSVFASLTQRFNGRRFFTYHNCAVGDEDKVDVINLNEYSPSSSILEMENLHKEAFEFTRNTVKQDITIKRLDNFIPEIAPDATTLVKIDVQGYELQVLRGGQGFIPRCGVIIIEMSFEKLYKEQPLFHEVYQELYRLGFNYHGNIEQLHHPVTHEILQADCLFVNRNL